MKASNLKSLTSKKPKKLTKKFKQKLSDESVYSDDFLEDNVSDPDEIEEEVDEDEIESVADEEGDILDEDEKPEKEKPKIVIPLPMPPKENYYVDTSRMESLIAEFNVTGAISDELAMCLFNIANRMIYMPKFINYTWKEEMIGDAILKELKAVINKKYNPEKGRAFAYFSKIVYYAFRNRIKIENKEHATIKEYQESIYHQLGDNYQSMDAEVIGDSQ